MCSPTNETLSRTWDCPLKGIGMQRGGRTRAEALEIARDGATEALGMTLMFRLRKMLDGDGSVTVTFSEFSVEAEADDKRGTAEGCASIKFTRGGGAEASGD